jgi:fatty-acid peroxygenase
LGRGRPVTLMPEVERLLTVAICGWVGVPIRTDEVSSRTGTLAALVDGAGNDPIAHVRARLARRRAERWLAEQIADYRRGRASDPTPFGRIATFEDVDGQMLPASVAASEVLNLLRPTVAIGRYITFAAMALHRHPGWRDRLTTSDGDGAVTAFVHEVRRFYPFFPAAAARTRVPVRWQGYELPAGRKVLLDLYGTNRDERSWEQPSRFRPERFFDWRGDPFTFVPQGGGDHRENHRCAGEWITIEVMRRAIEVLVGRIRYDVPDQDLSVSLRRIPTAPRSGFVIENVEVLAG